MTWVARALGSLPDPPKKPGEHHDWEWGLKASMKVANLPDIIAVPPPVSVLDQGEKEGSCVAQAGFQCIRAYHQKIGITNPVLGARQFGYYFSRAYMGTTLVDSGTTNRLFCQALNKFGFPEETYWPYLYDNMYTVPSFMALSRAFDQRQPTVYRRIYERGDDLIEIIRQTNLAGFPVFFGTDVSKSFVHNQVSGILMPPDDPKEVAGGHDLCIWGSTNSQRKVKILNSWGREFGENGYCDMSYDYIMSDISRDFMVVESCPYFSDKVK